MKISENKIRRLIRESLFGKRIKTINESIIDNFVAKAKEIGGDIANKAAEFGENFLKFYSATPAGLIFSSLTGCSSSGCSKAGCHWVWWFNNGIMSTCKYNLYAVSAQDGSIQKNFHIIHWPKESFDELISEDSIFCEKDFSKAFGKSEWGDIFEMLQNRKKDEELLEYTLSEETNRDLDNGGVCWAIDMSPGTISDARIPQTPGILIGIDLDGYIDVLNEPNNFQIIGDPVLVESGGGASG